jgi:hypothetical protein
LNAEVIVGAAFQRGVRGTQMSLKRYVVDFYRIYLGGFYDGTKSYGKRTSTVPLLRSLVVATSKRRQAMTFRWNATVIGPHGGNSFAQSGDLDENTRSKEAWLVTDLSVWAIV